VLSGHAPFISTMRVGLIDVYEKDTGVISQRILVSGGLVEVNPQQCTVLAEEAVPLEDITREALEADIKKQQDLTHIARNDEDREKLQDKIALLQAKLAVVSAATAH
jgi:F-type H+-transporting ATPase subunit epsilon